jgi:multiple sugar transport system ATP-binding protein
MTSNDRPELEQTDTTQNIPTQNPSNSHPESSYTASPHTSPQSIPAGALELRQLHKSYGPALNSPALNSPASTPVQGISLTVQSGEFLTLLGPSGCGKSTTLRLIAGLEQPTRGEIWVNGRDVTGLRPGDRNMAMVFQSYALYPHMTVFDNLASALKLQRVASDELRHRVQAIARVLDLDRWLERKPAQLSGGQRQRVALGRALVRRPAVFLLDEPLSNLDALLRERVRAELKQLFANQTAPVVYVTHDQTEAMSLSNLVAVLHEGRVQQLGKPQDIYHRPANRFVAGFVGSPQMNFWDLTPASIPGSALGSALESALLKIKPFDQPLTLGLRPEQVQIAQGDRPIRLWGIVKLVENLGMQSLVSVSIEDPSAEPLPLRLMVSDPTVQVGDRLPLTWDEADLHWFDGETGAALAKH